MIMQIEIDMTTAEFKEIADLKELEGLKEIKDKIRNGLIINGHYIDAKILSFREFFQLPNQLFDMDLSYGEIAVYACLMRFENRRSFTCYPSYKTIGKSIKMNSPNTVAKYVYMLEEKRLIETSPTHVESKDGKIQNGNLWYKIFPIEDAIEAFKEAQCDLVTVFTEEEIEKIRAEAFRKFDNGKPVYQQSAAYFLMLNTGLRGGEVCGIKNSDIDLENRVVHIRRGVKEIHVRENMEYNGKLEVRVGKLKSSTSRRDVPLNDMAIEMIKSCKRKCT